MLTLTLPEVREPAPLARNQVVLVTNADLRESANLKCWPVQVRFEEKFAGVLRERFGYDMVRAHPVKADRGHGFISTQREGSDVFACIDPGAVPFAHLKGGIAGATGYRQSPMYFAMGGATITGQGKAGRFLWARAHYEGTVACRLTRRRALDF